MQRYLPFFFLLFVMSSCQENKDFPCRASYTEKLVFTTSELALWPYNAADTLHFRTQASDTLVFAGNNYLEGYTALANPNNPECPDDSIGYPFKQIIMHNAVQSLDWTARTDQLTQQTRFLVSGQSFVLNYSQLLSPDSVFMDSANWNGTTFYALHVSAPASGDSLYFNNHFGIVRVVKTGQTYTLLP